MLTPKQKQSIDYVCEVFEVFFQKAYYQSSMIHADDALPVAAKLTQIYFDNHYPDGRLIGDHVDSDGSPANEEVPE